LFWSFRYYQTYFGVPLVADHAIVVPTAEADPAMRLDVLDRFFRLPIGFLFLTPEEQTLVSRRTSQPIAPSCVIGAGLDPVGAVPPSQATLSKLGITPPFVLYLGRIDPNKGCETLLEYFLKYRTQSGRQVQLVMAGPANMPIPEDPSVRALGFVDPETRDALLAHASLLAVPSPFESLSLALLEGWNHGVPALVNARCAVLKGQALRADGALYYRDFSEFGAGLTYLLDNPSSAQTMGQQGREYVDREYRWPQVISKIERFLGSLPVTAR
jgi:glycosyltransferase involved in cell wall biosynthesis